VQKPNFKKKNPILSNIRINIKNLHYTCGGFFVRESQNTRSIIWDTIRTLRERKKNPRRKILFPTFSTIFQRWIIQNPRRIILIYQNELPISIRILCEESMIIFFGKYALMISDRSHPKNCMIVFGPCPKRNHWIEVRLSENVYFISINLESRESHFSLSWKRRYIREIDPIRKTGKNVYIFLRRNRSPIRKRMYILRRNIPITLFVVMMPRVTMMRSIYFSQRHTKARIIGGIIRRNPAT
jgi:hypothetical protein